MMMATFGEVAEFINGRAFKPEEWTNDGLPIIRIQNLTGSTDIVNRFNGEFEPRYFVRAGDILISWSASLGVYKWSGEDAILNQHIFKVVPNAKLIDAQYFYYASQNALNSMIAQVHGATMQHITKEPFEATQIPLPPLPEQQRIAAILDRADRLRRTRRYAAQLSETFLPSVFIHLFGDPGRNTKGWDVVEIDEVLDKNRAGIRTGPFGSSLKRSEYVEQGIPVWGIDNVRPNEFIESGSLFITETKFRELLNYSVEYGDVLISRAGTVGRMCVAKPTMFPSIIGSNLLRVALDKSVVMPEYFAALFTHFMHKVGQLKMSSDENAYSFINPTILHSMAIPVPPLALQEKFARIVQQFERLRAQQREAERQAEHLFQTLLHRAFEG
jgi:type I restriction enzyme S subunit